MNTIKIIHDNTIDIATAATSKAIQWKNEEWSWSKFVIKVSTTHHTHETYKEYINGKKTFQDEVKNVGGYVGGFLAGGRRKKGSVLHRQLLTLDIDHLPTGLPGAFWDEFQILYGNAACLYSTHKHSPETPRYRLVLPLDRLVGVDEYQAIARRIAGNLGIENFDHTTFAPERLMYWPSTSKDGEFEFQYQDGKWLSADEVLGSYKDWRDTTLWPVSKGCNNLVSSSINRQGDPLKKPGTIGAFCRTYDIHAAIEKFLSDVYAPTDIEDRHTYIQGSTSGGLVVYEDKYAYSHHGTDPASMKLCNAFDLVRIHKFGDMDTNIKEDTPMNILPSFKAMVAFANNDQQTKDTIIAETFDFDENQEQSTHENIDGNISDEVYNNLPLLLQNACIQFQDTTDRDVFFIGAIGVLSGCFPNYIGHYDGKWVSPHLYVYILAPYGSGKGSMTYAYQVGQAIHSAKIERTKNTLVEYKAAQKKIKKENGHSDKEPSERPSQELLFIPANISKTAIIETMANNGGGGIIFETEGDTLTDTLNQDYATYSDVLRKAHHHEPVSYSRRVDKEYRAINKPHLAVVLSSTFDQLLSLIPTVENGLLSRFLFYILKPNKLFRDVFSKDKENYEGYFDSLGQDIEVKYNYLAGLDKPIYFHLTNEQEQKFLQHFGEEKEKINDELHGTVNRLGLICFRLSMVFSMLRIYEYVDNPVEKIICRDIDFENALQIVMTLQNNAMRVYEYISGKKNNNGNIKSRKLPEDLAKYYSALPDEFETKEGLKIAEENSIDIRRAERFFTDLLKFKRISHGKHAKIKSGE